MFWFRAFIALLAQAFAVAGFAAPTPARTEIEFSHQLDEERAERVEKLVERFNGQQKEYQLKLVRRVEGDAPKHINLVVNEELARFMNNRAKFKPLHELMHEAKEPLDGGKLSPELRAGISDAKGRLIALPVALSTPVLYINKTAFRKAGLDPEKPPKTWWETQQAADKLFDAGSPCPYTTSWPAWVHIDNLSAWNGADVADAKGRLNFNGLVQIKHIAMLSSWYKSRFFAYFGRRDEADRRFAAGDCGMLTSSSSLYATLNDNKTFETGVSSLPYHDDVRGAPHHTLADGASLWVGGGKKPAEYKGVARFISFLLGPETQVELTTAGGFLPMTPVARAVGRSRLLKADMAGLDIAYVQLQGKGSPRGLRVSQIEPVRMIVEEELEAVWSDKKPAKEALDTAVLRGNAVLPSALKVLLPL
ncbi:MAG: extracellular solute-binding protein [Betaproteobacteria bacterium]|nr:extracellular solute-binding protein [Betaproteobacteria bacterium]